MTKMRSYNAFEDEQLAKRYENYYETKYKRTDLLEKELLTELFAKLPISKTVLEIGCGTGHFTNWMQSKLKLQAIGLDSSKPMITEAKHTASQTVLIQGHGEKLPLITKAVDIAAFITSLEFMTKPTEALKEAARVAKAGLILGLINKASPDALRKTFKAKIQQNSIYSQAKFYSISDIKKLLENALKEGYEIVYWKTTVFSKLLSKIEPSGLPFGAFLGVAIKLKG